MKEKHEIVNFWNKYWLFFSNFFLSCFIPKFIPTATEDDSLSQYASNVTYIYISHQAYLKSRIQCKQRYHQLQYHQPSVIHVRHQWQPKYIHTEVIKIGKMSILFTSLLEKRNSQPLSFLPIDMTAQRLFFWVYLTCRLLKSLNKVDKDSNHFNN